MAEAFSRESKKANFAMLAHILLHGACKKCRMVDKLEAPKWQRMLKTAIQYRLLSLQTQPVRSLPFRLDDDIVFSAAATA